MNRLVTAFLCCLPGLAWSVEARAANVTYEAEAPCPSREDFEARVEDRAPGADDADVTVRARTDDPSAGFVGEVRRSDGEIVRRVEGRTCDAVVDALVLALSLDASKSEASSSDGAPSAIDAVGAPASEVPPSETPRPVDEVARVAPTPLGPATNPPDRATSSEDARRSKVTWSVGANAGASVLVFGGSFLGWSGAAFTEAAIPGALGWSRYRPTFRGGLKVITSDVSVVSDSGTFYGAQFDVCPLALLVISSKFVGLTLSACAHTQLGLARWRHDKFWGCRDASADCSERTDFVFGTGGLGRVALQFGEREKVRGFVEVSYGLGVGVPDVAHTGYVDMFVGGGVLFP